MNKFISSIRLFALIGVLSGGFAYGMVSAPGPSSVISETSAPGPSSLTEEQTRYLDYIESKIQAYVVFSTHWAQNFLNPQNNESYITHVNRYRDAFIAFEHDVFGSLRAEKRVAGTSDYGRAVILIHDIVAKVDDPAKLVYTILEKHRKSQNPTFLGMDLGSVEKYTEPAFLSGLQSQLKSLQTIFSRIYPALVKKVDIIIDSLEQRKSKKLGKLESWKVLKHRMSCK